MTKPSNFDRPWTAEDKATAMLMRSEGRGPTEIATTLGRSLAATKNKLQRLCLTEEQRKSWREAERRRYQARCPALDMIDIGPRPPSEVLSDRMIRLASAPRDLTAFMMGDPLPGYSALEKRT